MPAASQPALTKPPPSTSARTKATSYATAPATGSQAAYNVLMVSISSTSIAVIPWGGWKQTTKNIAFDIGKETPRQAAQRVAPVSATVVNVENVVQKQGMFVATADITYRWPFQIANFVSALLWSGVLLLFGDVMAGMAWELKFPKVIGVKLTGKMSGWT